MSRLAFSACVSSRSYPIHHRSKTIFPIVFLGLIAAFCQAQPAGPESGAVSAKPSIDIGKAASDSSSSVSSAPPPSVSSAIKPDESQVATEDWGALPKEISWERDGAIMTLVPAGEFVMGLNNPEQNGGKIQEGPAIRVYLSSFFMDKFEITNAQYDVFSKATGWIGPRVSDKIPRLRGLKEPARPVVGVTWEDAAAYAKWAEKELPSEAQWEKAARGTQSDSYPWGKWVEGYANTKENSLKTTMRPGAFPKDVSVYGIFDLAGNVSEWVGDYYDREYYSLNLGNPRKNPTGPTESVFSRCFRGGDYYSTRQEARVTNRRFRPANQALEECGFRCVRNLRASITQTPKPTPDSLWPTETPFYDPYGQIERELFAVWRSGEMLPYNLAPLNAGKMSLVTVMNLLPVEIQLTAISGESKVIFFNRTLPPMKTLEINLVAETNMIFYVRIPSTDTIFRTLPVFQSNSNPILVMYPRDFLPSITDNSSAAAAPPAIPELSVFYEKPVFPWNQTLFFNTAATTCTIQFRNCPIQDASPEDKKRQPFAVSIGPNQCWQSYLLPGKLMVSLFYLENIDAGAETLNLIVDSKFDARAILIKENRSTNKTIRIFTKDLPVLKFDKIEAKLGALSRR